MSKQEDFERMEDIDILRKLYGERTSLEGSLQKAESHVDDIKAELSKVNRLIGLLEEAELKRLKEKKTENENMI